MGGFDGGVVFFCFIFFRGEGEFGRKVIIVYCLVRGWVFGESRVFVFSGYRVYCVLCVW